MRIRTLTLVSLIIWGIASCQDKIDESDLYTFKGKTVYKYMVESENFTHFAYLMTKVKLSSKSASHVSELLSARGNYAVFAPVNKAIETYLDSLYNTKNYDITQCPDSTAEYIVRNSIIDCEQEEAYRSSQFQVGVLSRTNMSDRYIQIDFDNDADGSLKTMINAKSKIIQPDIEVYNGYIHGLDRVVDLSISTLPDLISNTSNLKIFSRMLALTGWADSTVKYLDEEYENNHTPFGSLDTGVSNEGVMGPSPKHRYYGYTAFVEPDSIFTKKWDIPEPKLDKAGKVTNYYEIQEAFSKKCKEAYPDATDDDFTSNNNAVNRFISYHLLPTRITWNRLVIHHNEMGYAFSNPADLSINCWEYYETMGYPRRLIKITEGMQTDGKRINRHAKYNDGFTGDYKEISCDRPGIKLSQSNGVETTNALNGFYYTMDDVLVYDEEVPSKVLNERLRFDFTAICPELITAGIRRIEDNTWRFIPDEYLKTNWWYNDDNTIWRYVPYWDNGNYNYQGDEINIIGQYDFIFRLPPVPYDGTWELRFCAPQIQHFGMFQVYIGNSRTNMKAIGLPLDFRLPASSHIIGWQADTDDPDFNRTVDKTMRNHGYMKNCMHDGAPAGGRVVTNTMRSANGNYIRLRKIIDQMNMKSNLTYYVRIKSVLENTRTCCMLDYFELCPKSVYNGPEEEDPW